MEAALALIRVKEGRWGMDVSTKDKTQLTI
jgi:hypothetical protein